MLRFKGFLRTINNRKNAVMHAQWQAKSMVCMEPQEVERRKKPCRTSGRTVLISSDVHDTTAAAALTLSTDDTALPPFLLNPSRCDNTCTGKGRYCKIPLLLLPGTILP